jgi:hypothetical protein
MHVSIQPLRQADSVYAALRGDGWAVESGPGGVLHARHPQAPDERAARSRLHDLGLLTAGSLRMEFCHPGPCRGAAQDA